MNSCIPEKYFTKETLFFIKNKLKQKDDFIHLLKKTKWGYYHNNDIFMFHAPVGNINLLKYNKNVEIVLSGFCVSPDAGFKFLEDYLRCGKKDYVNKLSQHSFNSGNMRPGICKILKDLYENKIVNDNYNNIFNKLMNKDMKIAFTQIFCPISTIKRGKASYVFKEINRNNLLKKYAEESLKEWFNNIMEIKQDKTILIIMGKSKNITIDYRIIGSISNGASESTKLLMCSRMNNDGRMEITNDKVKNSLLDNLKCIFKNKIYVVPHASYYDVHRAKYLEELKEYKEKHG